MSMAMFNPSMFSPSMGVPKGLPEMSRKPLTTPIGTEQPTWGPDMPGLRTPPPATDPLPQFGPQDNVDPSGGIENVLMSLFRAYQPAQEEAHLMSQFSNKPKWSGEGKGSLDDFIGSRLGKGKHEVIYHKIGNSDIEIIKNPSPMDISQLANEFKKEFPKGMGEPSMRTAYDEQGNKYIWRSDKATHGDVEPFLRDRFEITVSQDYDLPIKGLTRIYNKIGTKLFKPTPTGEGKVEYINVKDTPERARAIGMSKDAFDKLAKGMSSGNITPIVIDRESGQVLDGHHRLFVAEQIGIDKVPVIYIDKNKYSRPEFDAFIKKLSTPTGEQ